MAPMISIVAIALTFAGLELGSNSERPAVPDLITEVCIDPPGSNPGAAGNEYIEIYKTTSGNIGGCQLRNNTGAILFTFPDVYVPAGTRCVVFLRPGSAPPEGFSLTLQNGCIAFSANLASSGAKCLDRRSGGVQFYNGSSRPRLLDAVYWSETGFEPAGGTPGARGLVGFLDLSFQTGRPLAVDGTIGRAAMPVFNYTGSILDFTTHGGANAAGATPGRENSIASVIPSDLAGDSQELVTATLLRHAWSAARGWLQIEDARVEIINIQTGASSLSVQTRQTLDALDVSMGNAQLIGIVNTTFRWNSNPAQLGYVKTIQGDLDSGFGYGFSFIITETGGGFATNMQFTTCQTTFTIRAGGREFASETRESSTRKRLDGRTWRIETLISTSDFTNLPTRQSRGISNITEMPDGTRKVECRIEREAPFLPPVPRSEQDSRIHSELITIRALENYHNDDGERSVEIENMSFERDGVPVLTATKGFVSVARASTPRLERLGTRFGGYFMMSQIPAKSVALSENRNIRSAIDWTTDEYTNNSTSEWMERILTKGIVNSDGNAEHFAFAPAAGSSPLAMQSLSALRVPRVDFANALGAMASLASTVSGVVPEGASEVAFAGIYPVLEHAGSARIQLDGEAEISRDFKLSGK